MTDVRICVAVLDEKQNDVARPYAATESITVLAGTERHGRENIDALAAAIGLENSRSVAGQPGTGALYMCKECTGSLSIYLGLIYTDQWAFPVQFFFQNEKYFSIPPGKYYIDVFGAELPVKSSVLVHNHALGVLANSAANQKSFTLNERTGVNVYVNSGVSGVQFNIDGLGVMLCVQSAPTAFIPYTGTTDTITLPETIYGGTVDAVTGVGSKTWGYIASYNGESLPGEWVSDRDVYAAGTTPTTGAQVAYKLATPEPFQATGNQALPAVAGLNTVYTDGDSLTVTGRRDLVSALEDLQTTMTAVTTLISEGGLT